MGSFKQAYLFNRDEELPFFYYIGAVGCIGSVAYGRIQEYFESPRDFCNASLDELRRLSIFSEEQLSRLEMVKRDPATFRNFERAVNNGIEILPIEDDRYPENLKNIEDYAPVLFLKGKLPGPGTACVSIIGARECSGYGSAVAKRLGELFAERGAAVISGMARGIDSVSQYAALSAGGYSLAFLGGGVDVVYPRESRRLYEILEERGGIASEFAPGTEPLKHFFVRRNRLISGMSHVVCVVEAREKSGTLITVGNALEQGREVFAVPGRINDVTSFGTNELIRQGAGVINDLNAFVDDVVKRYGTTVKAPVSVPKKSLDYLTAKERAVAKCLDENSFTTEQMASRTGIPSFEVLGLCITLTEKCILLSMGAGRFTATDKGMEVRNRLLSGERSDEIA